MEVNALRTSGVEDRNYVIAFWKTNVWRIKRGCYGLLYISFIGIDIEFFFLSLFLADDAVGLWCYVFIGREEHTARPNSL